MWRHSSAFVTFLNYLWVSYIVYPGGAWTKHLLRYFKIKGWHFFFLNLLQGSMLQHKGKEQMAVNGLFKDYAIARFTDCNCYSYWPTYILYRGGSRCSSHIRGACCFFISYTQKPFTENVPSQQVCPESAYFCTTSNMECMSILFARSKQKHWRCNIDLWEPHRWRSRSGAMALACQLHLVYVW